MQNSAATTTLDQAETLARAYIDALAQAEGIVMRSMLHRRTDQGTAVDELFGTDDDTDLESPTLRADRVAAAILTARAVSTEPGLAKRLRRENPVVAIQTHTAEMTDLVEHVVHYCATPQTSKRKIVARDGTERIHTPDKGNSDIIASLGARHLVIGIAPDPRRHLPSALMRMAEYQISIPPLDDWTLRLVLEAVTSELYSGVIDANIVRVADLTDLSLSFRRDLTPQECLERLTEVVGSRSKFLGDGPTLEQLDGYGAAKTWGLELVADLADYRGGRITWDHVDHKGLLLSGPPGVGKTQFAKALAKSCGVPLIATSVAQWNAASYLSGALQAIRTVFGEAKRSAPAILFIDELDGISSREALRGEYVEYWSQIVNLLLECLAGIEDRAGVIVLGATNHPSKIDPAILRAGRLDHHIALYKPTLTELAKIFRFHLGPDALADVDLMQAALAGLGGTGADVEAWTRRARAAARRARRELTMDDLLAQIRGGAHAIPPKERHRIGIHEAGHALVGKALAIGNLIGVSVTRDGGQTELDDVAGGASEQRLIDAIAFLLAGRAAEELVFGKADGGSGGLLPTSDLALATKVAWNCETLYGYGTVLGLAHVPADQIPNICFHAGLLDAVKFRLDGGLERAKAILSDNRSALLAVGRALGERGYLSAADVEEIAAGAVVLDPGKSEGAVE